MVALHRDGIGEAPDLPPVRQRQAAEGVLLLVAVVVHEIDAPVEDCGAGVAFAHVNRPQLARFRRLPGAREAHLIGADAITVWPPELRPCAGKICRLAVGSNDLAGEDGVGLAAQFAARGLVGPRHALHERFV